MNKKIISGFAALPLMLASSMAFADAGGGQINFTGSVITAACSVATESVDQSYDFGSLSNSHLDSGLPSEAVSVPIKLTNCSSAVSSTVSVTFNGTTGTAADEIVTTGTTNTAVQILKDGVALTLGTPDSYPVTDGDMTLNYTAHVKKIADAPNVAEGSFDAVATFTLTYA